MLRSNAFAKSYFLTLDSRLVIPLRKILDGQNMTLHDWIDRQIAKELGLPIPTIVPRNKGGRPIKKDGTPLPPPPPIDPLKEAQDVIFQSIKDAIL